MILKGSQRSGAKQLGAHLLKTEENEHVEVHEVSGFVSETVQGAMVEAYAVSKGTKCKQHLFSVSLNPPEGKTVSVEVFEKAIRDIEDRTGLTGKPRVIVFHEKEGRRHCHAVWSRIDAETMTAKPLPFFKRALNEIAKQLFIENGWELPKGFLNSKLRDPRNFSLEEWQSAKRAGLNAKELHATVQECWAASDNNATFTKSLEDRGLFLACGDRRGHVAVTVDGEIFAVAKLLDKRTKEVTARLGDPKTLPPAKDVVARLAGEMGARIRSYVGEAKRLAAISMKPLIEQREAMKVQHQKERRALDQGQEQRRLIEQKERAARFRNGMAGAWDVLTGRYFKLRKQNEVETFWSMQRDRIQRDTLVRDQLEDRAKLQETIRQTRSRNAERLLGLYRHAAQYRRLEADKSHEKGQGLER